LNLPQEIRSETINLVSHDFECKIDIAHRDNQIFAIIRLAIYHPILLKEDIPIGNKRNSDDSIHRAKNMKRRESFAVGERTGF
jgi:hypothetical protein